MALGMNFLSKFRLSGQRFSGNIFTSLRLKYETLEHD